MQNESNTEPAKPVADDVTVVRLLQGHGIYNPGELVGFRTQVAEGLIKRRVAERFDRIVAPKAPEKEQPTGTKISGKPPVDKQQLPGVVKK